MVGQCDQCAHYRGTALTKVQAPALEGSGAGRRGPECADIQARMVQGLRDQKDRRIVICVAPLRRYGTVAVCCRPPLDIDRLRRPGSGVLYDGLTQVAAQPHVPARPVCADRQRGIAEALGEAILRAWECRRGQYNNDCRNTG
jgi:hypothetical protein